jgi:hypothetical protein
MGELGGDVARDVELRRPGLIFLAFSSFIYNLIKTGIWLMIMIKEVLKFVEKKGYP